jgi:hypothetical protein
MNFGELKQLIKEIRETLPCKQCGYNYKDSDIRIIGTVFSEGFFMAECRECKNEVIVNVVFKEKRMVHRSIGKSKTFQPITPDDILDIRNFLQNFDGDFANLFNKK